MLRKLVTKYFCFLHRIFYPPESGSVAARPAYGLCPPDKLNTRLPPATNMPAQLTAQPVGPVTRAKSAPGKYIITVIEILFKCYIFH